MKGIEAEDAKEAQGKIVDFIRELVVKGGGPEDIRLSRYILVRFDKLAKELGYHKLPILECLRCGHTWRPRTDKLPAVCPNPKCKSPYWNKPRKPLSKETQA